MNTTLAAQEHHYDSSRREEPSAPIVPVLENTLPEIYHSLKNLNESINNTADRFTHGGQNSAMPSKGGPEDKLPGIIELVMVIHKMVGSCHDSMNRFR